MTVSKAFGLRPFGISCLFLAVAFVGCSCNGPVPPPPGGTGGNSDASSADTRTDSGREDSTNSKIDSYDNRTIDAAPTDSGFDEATADARSTVDSLDVQAVEDAVDGSRDVSIAVTDGGGGSAGGSGGALGTGGAGTAVLDDGSVDTNVRNDAQEGRTDGALDSPTDTTADIAGAMCNIGMNDYRDGFANPNNPCQACQTSSSTVSWTQVADGSACGLGQVCQGGLCRDGCWIDRVFVQAAAARPGKPCQLCNPIASVSKWTLEKDGIVCGNGLSCNSGQCGSGCWIGGTFYASGVTLPGAACQACQPSVLTTNWSPLQDGVVCADGKVCNGGSCAAGCWTNGANHAPGELRPGFPCQSCQPNVSLGAWSNIANGADCGAAMVCSAGQCGSGCWIGGAFYASGATLPGAACQACQPSVSTTNWSPLPDGAVCADGKVCNGGSCAASCWINGANHTPGELRSGFPCQSCQPNVSLGAWSNIANGADCGTTMVCSAGQCQAGCWISSAYRYQGAAMPGNACQLCQPAQSTLSWTYLGDGSSCGQNQVCSAGACSAAYSITYAANGATSGSLPVDSTPYAAHASVTILGNTGALSKTCHAFSGWNSQADGSGTTYLAGATLVISANTTLYAQWTSMAAQTPAMTSNSHDGWTVSNGLWEMFNPAAQYNFGDGRYSNVQGSLQLPSGRAMSIDRVYVGPYWANTYYFSRTATIFYYYQGALSYAWTFDPVAESGQYVDLPTFLCDKIVNGPGSGSAWGYDGGWQAQQGKTYFGCWAN